MIRKQITMSNNTIPLSLYIHIPWCIKKCPYCDFNSHPQRGDIPEAAYISQLIADFIQQRSLIENREIQTIFIGGGTPSLFSPKGYQTLFKALKQQANFSKNVEVTIEANPGTLIPNRFEGYLKAGINRLSLGVQSFQNDKLEALGRIHNTTQAQKAITAAKQAGFDNFNIDLMFGLPNQTVADALFDLQTAIDLEPTHLSWYQLTLEPNTFFYRFPPALPDDEKKFTIQTEGQALLSQHNFNQYEVSAYAKNNLHCQHNLNYWLFGDYIGIGAGAHGKTTTNNGNLIQRHWNAKHPKQYLTEDHKTQSKVVSQSELPLEFMMNALRLHQPITFALFEARTGLPCAIIEDQLNSAVAMGLVTTTKDKFSLTKQGMLFLNEVLGLF